MKNKLLVVALASACMTSGFAHAQDTITSELNASLRLGLGLTTEPEAELTFEDYASRIGWKGTADAGNGLKALSRVEFGYDQDAGVSTTRFAYLGVEGDFGTVTGGKQYRAFYDAVSSAIDIAYWGSCGLEIACARQSSVVKYVGPESNDLRLMASATLVEGDLGNDFIDGLDLGATMASGDMTLGAGITLDLGNNVTGTDVFGNEVEIELDTGIALGFSAIKPLDDATISATLQYANDDFLGSEDNGFLVTAAYKKDQYYGVLNIADADNTPFYATIGYEKPIIDDKAFTYFEISISDEDVPGSDTDFEARAVMVYNLDILSTGK